MTTTTKMLWKHSASLIVLGREAIRSCESKANHKVLMLQRPSKSSYPEAFVFPGGVAEQADQLDDWLKLYEKFGVDENRLNSLTKKCSKRSFIFSNDSNSIVSRDISLRLTAIRETFEELGILFCRQKDQLTSTELTSTVKTNFDVPFWQKEIYGDATKFIDLCEELKVVPDLWSLYEWSVWLTPTTKRTKRFETVFYLVGLNEQTKVHVESDEVKGSLWSTPADLLAENKSGNIWLPPPQFYELSRLNSAPDFDRLLSFAKTRSENSPTTCIFPIHYETADGLLNCYPGDDFYPAQPTYEKTSHDIKKYADKTCEECRAMAKNLHRVESKSLSDSELYMNIRNFDDHLSPKSKL